MSVDNMTKKSILEEFKAAIVAAKIAENEARQGNIISMNDDVYAQVVQEITTLWSGDSLRVALDAIEATSFAPGHYLCAFLPCNENGTLWSADDLRVGKQFQFAPVTSQSNDELAGDDGWVMLLRNVLKDTSLVRIDDEMSGVEVRTAFNTAFQSIYQRFVKKV